MWYGVNHKLTMPKKILCTGIAGFVGSHLLRHIIETTDWIVLGLDGLRYAGNLHRIAEYAHHPQFQFIYHDFRAQFPPSILSRLSGVDYIIHNGAETHVHNSLIDPRPFVESNVVGTFNVLEAARTLGCERYVQVSTDEVYGAAPEGTDHREDAPIRPSNPYCLHPKTLVQMTDGTEKPIADIKIGDGVVAFCFKENRSIAATVTNTFSYPAQELYRVRIRNTEILATENHKFFTKRPHRFKGRKLDYDQDFNMLGIFETPANKLQTGDWVCTTRHLEVLSHPGIEKDFARLLGYFIGDGYIKKSRNRKSNTIQKTLTLADSKLEFIKFYQSLLPNLGCIYKHKTKNCWYVQAGNKELISRLEAMDGVTNKASTKHLPDTLLKMGNEATRNFIGGLFDADGSSSNGKVEICSFSARLRRQVKMLLARLGIYSTINGTKVSVADGLSVMRFASNIPSLKKVNGRVSVPQRTSMDGNIVWQPIQKPVSEPYAGVVFDIETTAGNFVVEQDVVVHNSATKAGADALAFAYWQSFRLPVVRTNTMNLFGERQHVEKMVPMTIRKVLAGEVVTVHGSPEAIGSRKWLHARNQAAALCFLLTDAGVQVGDTYHVAGDEKNNLEIATLIAAILGRKLEYEMLDFHAVRLGHDRRYSLDDRKLRSLGWKPQVDFLSSLQRTVEWTVRPENRVWLEG